MPMMNPSPSEVVELFELFTFVEVTLIQYATVAGHFPGVAGASAKTKPEKINKLEVAVEDPPKEEAQAHAVTPKPKAKGQGRGSPPASPPTNENKPPEAKKGGKGGGKGKCSKSEPRVQDQRRGNSNASPSSGAYVRRATNANTSIRLTMREK